MTSLTCLVLLAARKNEGNISSLGRVAVAGASAQEPGEQDLSVAEVVLGPWRTKPAPVADAWPTAAPRPSAARAGALRADDWDAAAEQHGARPVRLRSGWFAERA